MLLSSTARPSSSASSLGFCGVDYGTGAFFHHSEGDLRVTYCNSA